MEDKTVVITGATSGLGRATALQLAQKGDFVIIVARSNTKANEVIKEIKKEGGKAQSDYPFPMNIIVPIVGFFIGESPEQAADTPVWLASSNEVKGVNGEYVHHRKIKKSWPPTRDENAQTRLYNVTQSMLGEWL
ncbi:MAG: SDR family NAD(P)-dependent oxidoreductase [Bacteroidetes bacterium]|nr:SDR family NAD(P)-dependent oxidoreductase [Bacteroidota bacterium]